MSNSEEKSYFVISISVNCTDKLQPMDLGINKELKQSMKQQFSEWYSLMIYQNFTDEFPPPIDLHMSIMKPLGAK